MSQDSFRLDFNLVWSHCALALFSWKPVCLQLPLHFRSAGIAVNPFYLFFLSPKTTTGTRVMARKEGERDYIDYDELEESESHLMLDQIGRRSRQSSLSHRRQLWLRSMIVLAVLLAMAANAGVWILVSKRPRDALDEEWNHCGRSSADAISLGCVMEPLFYGWMPRQCVYQDLTDRYPVFEDRKWYLEQDLIVSN